MKRGEIWVANLNPPRGRETGKIRPVLIMQADELNAIGPPMVVVLPLTTRIYPGFTHWRVTLEPRGRLLRASQIMVDQPRALDRRRIGEGPLAVLSPEEMAEVERRLCAVLGLDT